MVGPHCSSVATVDDLLQQPREDKATALAALDEARERTWTLVDPLSDADLTGAVTDYLSPPVWDLGHMANFEERWLVQHFLECGELRDGFNDIYNAFKHARKDRPKLRLLDRDGVRTYMAEVRDRTRQVLAELDGDCDPRYEEDLFLHWMLVPHEHQHQETLLQTIQMRGHERYKPAAVRALPAPKEPLQRGWILVPEGRFRMGTDHVAGVYDNEAPAHDVDVPEFRIARYPVTCGEYLAFVEGGGYEEPEHWSERGRDWLTGTDHHAPLHWHQVDGTWHRRDVRGSVPVEAVADEILCHVSFFEAEAYASWLGVRLPTEAEWEKAARWNPDHGVTGRNPWGDPAADTQRANIDHLSWGPSRIGSHPDGASPLGVEHMIGDVWEWTSSGFEAYPGFEAFPYDEYSKVFFGGDYRVLRGGAWAARAGCSTGTFRNWDHPYRRQIFAGIRLARDV